MYKPEDYKIEIYYSDEDQCYIGKAPELQGCITHGETRQECLEMLNQAIALWIETALEDGEELPSPISKVHFSGTLSLRIEPELHKKTAIAAQSSGDSINKFIEKTLKKNVV